MSEPYLSLESVRGKPRRANVPPHSDLHWSGLVPLMRIGTRRRMARPDVALRCRSRIKCRYDGHCRNEPNQVVLAETRHADDDERPVSIATTRSLQWLGTET